MIIALAQMHVTPMQIEKNLIKIKDLVVKAKEKKADIIAFPELCIGGYLLGDHFIEDDFVEYLDSKNEELNDFARLQDISIIWGNLKIDKTEKGKDGRFKRYNSVFISDHGYLQSRNKQYLPTYRFFDDQRYFSTDDTLNVKTILLPYSNKIIGLEICEELWNADKTDYGNIDITEELFKQDPDFIINISASPFSVNKGIARDNRIQQSYKNFESYKKENKIYKDTCPFLYVNCVGTQNNGKSLVTFDGDSRAYTKKGKIDVGLKPYVEDILYFNYQEGILESIDGVPVIPKTPIEQKKEAIIEAFKDIDEWCGYHPKKIIIGMSGGVDSSLSACLAVEALGRKRVVGINLPSKYNSNTTKSISNRLAQDLGIEYKEISITNPILALQEINTEAIDNIHEENLHARIRGLILQTQAGLYDGVVICNSNKVEVFAGFSTYGSADDIGAMAPIADLLKTEIFEMARLYYYFPKELLPDDNMNFEFAPSAELKVNQRDPFCWGLSDAIIDKICNYHRASRQDIIDMYDNGTLAPKHTIEKYYIVKENFIEHLDWLLKLYRKSVFKRNQYPPIVVTSKSAFGADFREIL
ncbi:MAG: NAD(+) synthase [Acholeplasmatales bacterium]|jgi:NAD+ synthase (glutamine-hydrolysing)|nr:NAD(+) synthase [Acholeplasmatales bacterium]